MLVGKQSCWTQALRTRVTVSAMPQCPEMPTLGLGEVGGAAQGHRTGSTVEARPRHRAGARAQAALHQGEEHQAPHHQRHARDAQR